MAQENLFEVVDRLQGIVDELRKLLYGDDNTRVVGIVKEFDLLRRDVAALVGYVDARAKNKYFTLAEERALGGSLKLGYALDEGFKPGKPQMRYAPDDSPMAVVANPDGVIAGYELRF